ncbi:MAG: PilZ domain-containing protein [Oricola sp.]
MLGAQQNEFEHDRRQYQRVKVLLHGRLMLSDRSEHRCQVTDMSPGSAFLATEGAGQLGERVIAYVDHIGRIEGKISRVMPDGFALELNTTPRKKAKLAAQLTWLANKHELDLPEDRRHERIAPRNPAGVLSLEDGRQYRCRIIDLSLSGAAIEISVRPAIGTQVTLGNMRGQVVRHFEDGIAVEFAVVQRRESLKQYLG